MKDYGSLINECEHIFKKECDSLIQLIRNENFLAGNFKLEGYEITTDKTYALKIYEYQEAKPKENIYISYPDMLTDVPFETNTKTFDLLEENEEVYDDIMERYFHYENLLVNVIDEYCQKNNLWDYVDIFTTDFVNFYEYKALPIVSYGCKESLFLDRQLEVYLNGGFPFCWKGRYPKGTLAVLNIKWNN